MYSLIPPDLNAATNKLWLIWANTSLHMPSGNKCSGTISFSKERRMPSKPGATSIWATAFRMDENLGEHDMIENQWHQVSGCDCQLTMVQRPCTMMVQCEVSVSQDTIAVKLDEPSRGQVSYHGNRWRLSWKLDQPSQGERLIYHGIKSMDLAWPFPPSVVDVLLVFLAQNPGIRTIRHCTTKTRRRAC